ncbi:MAG: hypothetical protein AAGA72_09130 [Pseudomonadota bacterium]
MWSGLVSIGLVVVVGACATATPPTKFGPITAEEIEPLLPKNIGNPEHMDCVRNTAKARADELGDPIDIPRSEMNVVQEGNRPISGDTKRLIVANNVVLEAVTTCHGEFN